MRCSDGTLRDLSDPGQASLIRHRESTLRDSAFLPRTSV